MIAVALSVRAPAPGLWEMVMPGRPEYVREARALARTASSTPYQADAAALCVSELVTNAIVHSRSGQSGGTVTVTIAHMSPGPDLITSGPAAGELRISVTDNGGPALPGPWSAPLPADGPDTPEHGYGLAVVDAVASDWGRFTTAGGWCSWCEIPNGDDR
jgi:anti-sigma regulatory factor (Ser/Thr protein kinase)